MNGNTELMHEWFKKADHDLLNAVDVRYPDGAIEIDLDDAQEAYEMANRVTSFVTGQTRLRSKRPHKLNSRALRASLLYDHRRR